MRLFLSRNVLVWILQAVLALFFVLASGAPKLLLPAEALPMPMALPQWFLYVVGTCEVLGGLGLVLPMLSPVRRAATRVSLAVGPRLTVAAATCLVLLTICAAIYQSLGHQPSNAVFALVIGALCATVAILRRRGLGTDDRAASAPAVVSLA